MAEHDLTDDRDKRLLGHVIDGRYRVLDPLGEGGMGAVFVAEHVGLQKEVAIKVVRPEHAGNAGLAARFAREAMVTSQIDHPNVISTLDFGTLEDGSAYLVTQLVRGLSLAQLLETEGTLHWARAAALGAQIADALCAAKAHGIVHRDLKPENVLVQRGEHGQQHGQQDGEVAKVLDFGIAKYARDSLAPPPMAGAQRVTQVGMVVGTPGYMAPEQALGQRADHRADLYALGVVLWECIVGRKLWTGEDVPELIANQLKNVAPGLREASSDGTIPVELDALVASLLASAVAQRPDEPSAVRDALRELAAGRVTSPKVALVARASTTSSVSRATRPLRAVVAPKTPSPTTPFVSLPPPANEHRPGYLFAALMFGLCALMYVSWASGFVHTGDSEGSITIAPLGELGPRLVELWARRGLPARDGAQGAGHAERTAGASGVLEAGASPHGTGLPAALEPQLALLVQGATREQRVEAARALLGHIPIEQTPPYVRALARFQLAESCTDKREPFELLTTLEDVRALPVLVLASDRARNGCSRRDCLACMRSELDGLIAALERKAQAGAASPR